MYNDGKSLIRLIVNTCSSMELWWSNRKLGHVITRNSQLGAKVVMTLLRYDTILARHNAQLRVTFLQ